MYGWMDAGGLFHRLQFKLLFATERSQGFLPAIFFMWELERYFFLLNVKFTSKAPILDWAA